MQLSFLTRLQTLPALAPAALPVGPSYWLAVGLLWLGRGDLARVGRCWGWVGGGQ